MNDTTFRVEKIYSTGKKHFEDVTFQKRCEAYNYLMNDFISETLNRAYDEMSDADFTWLCSKVISRVAEYLQR